MKALIKNWTKIKEIKIQGATNIARFVVVSLAQYAKLVPSKSSAQFINNIRLAGVFLLSARETEPMADNAVEFILADLIKVKNLPVEKLKKTVASSAEKIIKLIDANENKIVKYGSSLVKNGARIMTHCHSSTVIKILEQAKKNKKKFEVFQTETRPLMQGHKTAVDLVKAGIKDTLVVDSAVAYLMSDLSGEHFDIDLVIIGADSIARDGSCVNKIGSYAIASAAFDMGVPVYIATQALKINEDAKNLKAIKIEQRDAAEVWPDAPKGLKIYNPAFDKIPAKMITGIITEFGIVKPKKLFAEVKKKYQFIFVK